MKCKYLYKIDNLSTIMCQVNNISKTELDWLDAVMYQPTKIKEFMEFLATDKPLRIVSDSDADGLSSLAIVRMFLDAMFVSYEFVTLERTNRNPESMLEDGKKHLLLDCASGIMPETITKYDIFVFDHHEPQYDYTNLNVVNPKVNHSCEYLCTSSLVWLYFKSLNSKLKGVQNNAVQYAAIGTVADVVPLLYDNRYIVKYGLEQINTLPDKNIKTFIDKLKLKNVDETSIGFYIAPTINAASRFGQTEVAVKGYVEGDLESIKTLIDINTMRKKSTAESFDTSLISEYPTCIVALTEKSKVAGLVATKLSFKHKKPTIVINNNGSTFNFSIRSLGIVDIPKFLEVYEIAGGGHHAAGGGEVSLDKLDWLIQSFQHFCDNYSAVIIQDNEYVAIKLQYIESAYREMLNLKPFGMGWKAPTFVAKMQLKYKFSMGAHYKMKVSWQGTEVDAMYFNPPQEVTNGQTFVASFEIIDESNIIVREVL